MSESHIDLGAPTLCQRFRNRSQLHQSRNSILAVSPCLNVRHVRPSPFARAQVIIRPDEPQCQSNSDPFVRCYIDIENQGRGYADDLYLAIHLETQNSVNIRYHAWEDANWDLYSSGAEIVFLTKSNFHRLVPGTMITAPTQIHLELTSPTAGPATVTIRCGSTNAAGNSCKLTLSKSDCERIHENLRHNWDRDPSGWEVTSGFIKKRITDGTVSEYEFTT